MDQIKKWLGYPQEPLHLYLVLASIAVGSLVFWKLKGRRKPFPPCPPDTVQLFQFNRGHSAPSLSPFVLKLETYLRMANIPYKNVFGFRFSPKGKIPWIRYNGTTISDSELIIKFLNKLKGLDFNKHLSDKEKAIALSFQRLADEHLFWALMYHRWVTETGFQENDFNARGGFFTKFLLRVYYRPYLVKQIWSQGLSRHTPSEIYQFILEDLKAIEDWMGDKKFLMGDEPCETDCAVFGILVQILWQIDPKVAETLPAYPSLVAYCERMRERFWPDWDQCIKPRQPKATQIEALSIDRQ